MKKIAIMSELQLYLRNYSIFPLFILFFYISILNLGQFISQFINVIVPNNDLLMDEMKVIYFAPKMVAIRHDLVTSNCC